MVDARLAATLSLLLLVPLGAADWPQHGLGPGHSGVAEGKGPERPDVALSVRLQVDPEPSIVILDGIVYAVDANAAGTGAHSIRAIDLATGGVRDIVVDFEPATDEDVGWSGRDHLIAHEGRLLLVADGSVTAFTTDGTETWQVPLFDAVSAARSDLVFAGMQENQECGVPTVADGMLFVACIRGRSGTPGAPLADPFAAYWVSAIDVVAAQRLWVSAPGVEMDVEDPALFSQAEWRLAPIGASFVDGQVVAAWAITGMAGCTGFGGDCPARTGSFVVALDPSRDAQSRIQWWDGQLLVAYQAATGPSFDSVASSRATLPIEGPGRAAVWDSNGALRVYDVDGAGPTMPFDPSIQSWDTVLAADDQRIVAAHGRDLIVAGLEESALAVVGGMTLDAGWSWGPEPDLPTGGRAWSDGVGGVIAGSTFYGTAWHGLSEHIVAVDLVQLDVLWDYPFHGHILGLAIEDGVLVAVGEGLRNVVVLGENAASLAVAAELEPRNPGPGETVRFDLSGTRPGAQGAATEFQVTWGDGDVDPWQESPIFYHSYRLAADHDVLLEARNLNQTSSLGLTIRVGAEPHLNALQRAFAPHNQDMTWGVIGLGAILIGAAFTAWGLRRKRSVLRREMAALEAAYQEGRRRPDAGEMELEARRKHIRGLVLAGRLEEPQAFLLERRADELVQQLRMSAVSSAFDFLPHGLVKTLQSMLADARITQYEARRFEDLLALEKGLTPRQRAAVLETVRLWFRRDEAGG